MTEQAIEGVEAVATHRTPVTRGYAFTMPVQAAIEAGLARDEDPTWWAADIGARPKVGLTEKGMALARACGWTFTCACSICSRELLLAERRDVRGLSFGPCCSGSAAQYGVREGSCGFHDKLEKRKAGLSGPHRRV